LGVEEKHRLGRKILPNIMKYKTIETFREGKVLRFLLLGRGDAFFAP